MGRCDKCRTCIQVPEEFTISDRRINRYQRDGALRIVKALGLSLAVDEPEALANLIQPY